MASAQRRLQASYIDARAIISPDDVAHQYNEMMVAVADIQSAGGDKPADSLLIATFENALSENYATIRQLARRQKHTTSHRDSDGPPTA